MKSLSQNAYPAREDMCREWETLAQNIFESKSRLSNEPDPNQFNKNGSLIIIGSGIQSLGFSMNDIKVLEDADKVFYCVADPATIVWLKKLRPDAYDLYTLYDDNKVRYHTYMQMTEAMLYYLREGKKVAAVFYGHPGVFVLSTHRAVAIARREGLHAEMRPGVSALDCLCADVGIDPSSPGMVTYEATDMLMRLRKPDISLHVILWQVGLIAEMGYRRGGFINNNFAVLIEYLQQFYGSDFEIVHYIASRYPTIPSKIERYKLHQLLDPRIRKSINGLSTFYIPPKEAAQANLDMCVRLGLAKPGQTIKATGPLREIDKYNFREMKAVQLFENFRVPEQYQYQDDTPVSQFLICLSQDEPLQQLYKNNPEQAIEQFEFLKFSEKDKEALLSRDEGRIQLAAKGLRVRSSNQERFVMKMLASQQLAKKVVETIQQNKHNGSMKSTLEALAKEKGCDVDWNHIPAAIDNVHASALLPWTGIYADVQRRISLIILGNHTTNAKSLLFVDTQPIVNFTFNNYTLLWKKEEGNTTSGCIQFSLPQRSGAYIRSVTGRIWTGDEPTQANFNAVEQVIDESFTPVMPDLQGRYSLRCKNGEWHEVTLLRNGSTIVFNDDPAVTFNQQPKNNIRFATHKGKFTSGELTFIADPFTGRPSVFGKLHSPAHAHEPMICYGIKSTDQVQQDVPFVPGIPLWLMSNIRQVSAKHQQSGGLLLYNHYAKMRFTGRLVSQLIRFSNLFLHHKTNNYGTTS